MAGVGSNARLMIMVLKVENPPEDRIGQLAQRVAHGYLGAKVVMLFAILEGRDAPKTAGRQCGHIARTSSSPAALG